MARTKHPHEFDAFIDAVCKDLKINPVPIRWRSQTSGYDGIAYYGYDSKIIMLKGHPIKKTAHTLAHELRHIWQYTSGTLKVSQTIGYDLWQGVLHPRVEGRKANTSSGLALYRAQPWEVDANDYADTAVATFAHLLPAVIKWHEYKA